MSFTVPVLFATFARPEYARKTFDQIKKAKPKSLYFYSNKARKDNPEEICKNEIIRAYIREIDWECDLKTYFREEYVDVYTSLYSAYDWVFDNEEQAIILEEDCVPSLAFFDFCEQLLPLYKDDIRIWLISGNNLIEGYNPNGYDYIFTRYAYQYGWATWSSRWKKIIRGDIPVEKMINYKLFKQLYISDNAANYQVEHAENAYNSQSWDLKLGLTIKCNGGFGIVPTSNLVSNIGIKGENNSIRNRKFHDKIIPNANSYKILKHPDFVIPDFSYEKYFFKKIIGFNIINRLKNILKSPFQSSKKTHTN